jgi:hypothetical protein
MQTVICVKWGTRYSAAYVNTLWSMLKRNTRRETRLLCYTDDKTDLGSEITTYPIPEFGLPQRKRKSTWRKLALWSPHLEGVSGDVLFFDLDVVITGLIDDFFDYAPDATFCVIENWTQRGRRIGNTSVYRFRVGAHDYLCRRFEDRAENVFRTFPNEQTYVSRNISEMTFWPRSWCLSFKHNLLPMWPLNFLMSARLPKSAKVVCFTGKPDPHEARDGIWPCRRYERPYKHVRPTPWIGQHWR